MFFKDLTVNQTLLKCFYGLVILFLVNYLFKFVRRVSRLPPGPWGLPFVGYLPFIRQDGYKHITELADRYGPVYSFKCGDYDLVIVNQWKYVKEGLANDHLLGRPKETLLSGIMDHPSFFEMTGEPWRQHRRLALTILRDVGFGKSEMEDSIRDEIKSFTDAIKSSKGKPKDFSELLSLSISNNISALIYGHKYEYDDPVALEMDNNIIKTGKSVTYFNAATFMPSVSGLLIKLGLLNLSETRSFFKKFESHVINEVKEHQKKDKDREIKDYIDGFLVEMDKRQNEKDSTFNFDTLQRNAGLFYGAGSDTISNTLEWCFTLLVKYPEYQDKIREEIRQTIGLNRQPDNVDRQQMPLTMAFIYEVLRFSSTVPLNLLRRATEDTKVGDYFIPKDTLVTFNFWSVHFDPNLWDKPEQFKPERFLSEDKSKAIKSPHLLAFSAGKRVCPGESFAYLQLFLYLVSILQHFEIKNESKEDITSERVYYLVLRPKVLPDFLFKSID